MQWRFIYCGKSCPHAKWLVDDMAVTGLLGDFFRGRRDAQLDGRTALHKNARQPENLRLSRDHDTGTSSLGNFILLGQPPGEEMAGMGAGYYLPVGNYLLHSRISDGIARYLVERHKKSLVCPANTECNNN